MVLLNCWLKSTEASHTRALLVGVGVALTLVSPLSAVTGTRKLVPESSEISTDIESVSESASETSKVISTNFIDLVQEWSDSSPGSAFADMESATGIDIGSGVMLTKATFVEVFENYLHFFYVEEGGVTYPARHAWSSLGDETDFDRDGAGDAGARDYTLGKFITGVGLYTGQNADILVTFTNSSIETEWLVTDSLVFQWDTHLTSLGCAAPDTVVNDVEGNLYFYGTDLSFHRLFDPRSLRHLLLYLAISYTD